jgi:TolB-like protein
VTTGGASYAEERDSIAILPVVVHSNEDPDYLRAGLADMLASRIEQAGVLTVIRVDKLKTATTNLESAIESGRDAGADFVLFGSFTRFGDGASLDMQCASTSKSATDPPLREIFVHSGSIGEVIPDLQDLVGKISRFTVVGYEETQAVSAGPASSGGDGATSDAAREEIEQLWMRVQALEDVVRRLEEAAGSVSFPDELPPVDADAVEDDSLGARSVEVDAVEVDTLGGRAVEVDEVEIESPQDEIDAAAIEAAEEVTE